MELFYFGSNEFVYCKHGTCTSSNASFSHHKPDYPYNPLSSYQSQAAFLTAKQLNHAVSDLADLKQNQPVGVFRGSPIHDYLRDIRRHNNFLFMKTVSHGVSLLESRKVAAIVHDEFIIREIAHENCRVEAVGSVYNKKNYALAFAKDLDPAIRKTVDKVIIQAWATGAVNGWLEEHVLKASRCVEDEELGDLEPLTLDVLWGVFIIPATAALVALTCFGISSYVKARRRNLTLMEFFVSDKAERHSAKLQLEKKFGAHAAALDVARQSTRMSDLSPASSSIEMKDVGGDEVTVQQALAMLEETKQTLEHVKNALAASKVGA